MTHGRHIKVVGFAQPERLASVDAVREFLLELVKSVGMRALGAPVMHDVELDLSKMNVEPFEDEGGVTGVCVLSTSHCAIHTWPAREFFVLDLYSCRDFQPTEVIDLAKDRLGASRYRMTDLSHALAPPV